MGEWAADASQPVLGARPGGPRRIEHDYREMKQALGLAHFEGRTFTGWHHHVTLISVAHAFCTLQRLARAPKDAAAA